MGAQPTQLSDRDALITSESALNTATAMTAGDEVTDEAQERELRSVTLEPKPFHVKPTRQRGSATMAAEARRKIEQRKAELEAADAVHVHSVPRIAESFQQVSASTSYPGKPELKPVKVWNVLPDASLWAANLVSIIARDDIMLDASTGKALTGRKRRRAAAQSPSAGGDVRDMFAASDDEEGASESQTDAAAALEKRARLGRALIRTPAEAARSVAAGLVGTVFVPSAQDAVASTPAEVKAAAESTGAAADGDVVAPAAPTHMERGRDTNMVIYPYAKNTPELTTAQNVEQHMVMVFDNETMTVRLAPLAARAVLSALPKVTSKNALVCRRRPTPVEADHAQIVAAQIAAPDAQAALSAVRSARMAASVSL